MINWENVSEIVLDGYLGELKIAHIMRVGKSWQVTNFGPGQASPVYRRCGGETGAKMAAELYLRAWLKKANLQFKEG
jgi:hypothetical protein